MTGLVGILIAILVLLAVVALAVVIHLQRKALAEARRNADEARLEQSKLARQIYLSSKLAALTTLIDAANHEIYRTGAPSLGEQRDFWEERKKALLEEMDATFDLLREADGSVAAPLTPPLFTTLPT